MERVVTINLNGNPYQLDESAYDVLRAYLDSANAALASNPDRAEIIRDLEQAIADKCASYLSPAKSVVSIDEMKKILDEMGPVEGAEAAAAQDGAQAQDAPGAKPRKRIYRIRDDAKIAGVCSGIGAYFDIDANIVRLVFIILALVTHGFWVLAYIAMMFIIPSAHTSEEWAAAHGIPFNAQQVIDEAKRSYQDFAADGPPWLWHKGTRRAWKRTMRERARGWRRYWAYPTPPAPAPVTPVARIFGGLFSFIFAIINAALVIAFLFALFSLITTGFVLSWAPPLGVPVWVAIVAICIVFAALSGPLRALQGMSVSAMTGYPSWRHHDGGLGGIVILCLVGWLFYTNVPAAHVWMDEAWLAIRTAFEQVFHVTFNVN